MKLKRYKFEIQELIEVTKEELNQDAWNRYWKEK